MQKWSKNSKNELKKLQKKFIFKILINYYGLCLKYERNICNIS
jgi:hypothetical protein